jgi:GMP synthase (glutamine-hydrolysing)
MKKAFALRHVAFEDLGCLEPILKSHGYEVAYFDLGVESLSGISPLEADLVIALGGPISVYDLHLYPFLQTEIAWLRARLIEDLPTLGICLGAQLMAAALNAKVYPGAKGKEIGWAPLTRGAHSAEAGYMDHIIGRLVDSATHVFHWHGDTFDLPAGAKHLASSERYANQAFSVGKNCLALQFHPEFEVSKVEQWLIGHAHEISHEISKTHNLSQKRLRSDTRKHAAAFQIATHNFWDAWLTGLQGGKLSGKQTRPRIRMVA